MPRNSSEQNSHIFKSKTNTIRKHIEKRDHWGYTPLHLAALNSTPYCARAILDAVESVKEALQKRDKKGNTPVHVASSKGKQM